MGILEGEMVNPVSLDVQLLKALLPEVTFREGSVVAARIIQRQGNRGILSLAGRQLEAQLPSGLEAGRTVRLEVQEVTPERLLLRVAEPTTNLIPAATLPLPGDRQANLYVTEREADPERPDSAGVALVYESATLGRMDLRLDLAAGTVRVNIGAAAGAPADSAEAGAEELREALTQSLGRPAQVSVTPRREPLDLYA